MFLEIAWKKFSFVTSSFPGDENNDSHHFVTYFVKHVLYKVKEPPASDEPRDKTAKFGPRFVKKGNQFSKKEVDLRVD